MRAASGRGWGAPSLLHAIVLPVVVLIWMVAQRAEDEAPRVVMTVSLGGAPGPRTGGMTPMGGACGRGGAAHAKPGARRAAGRQGAGDGAAESARRERRRRRRSRPRRRRTTPRGARPPKAAEAPQGSAVAETGANGRRLRAHDRRRRHRRLPGRRQLLLPRVSGDDDSADPAELEREAAGRRRHAGEVHNPARRPADQRRDREVERLLRARPDGAARAAGDPAAAAAAAAVHRSRP